MPVTTTSLIFVEADCITIRAKLPAVDAVNSLSTFSNPTYENVTRYFPSGNVNE